MPPFEEGGTHCYAYVGRSVAMSVSLNLVQLITEECFAPEASNIGGYIHVVLDEKMIPCC